MYTITAKKQWLRGRVGSLPFEYRLQLNEHSKSTRGLDHLAKLAKPCAFDVEQCKVFPHVRLPHVLNY
jgi:hypothetical protein